MAGPMEISTGLSDALTILGAAGIVIPAFARIRISPVIGFILVGMVGVLRWLPARAVGEDAGYASAADVTPDVPPVVMARSDVPARHGLRAGALRRGRPGRRLGGRP